MIYGSRLIQAISSGTCGLCLSNSYRNSETNLTTVKRKLKMRSFWCWRKQTASSCTCMNMIGCQLWSALPAWMLCSIFERAVLISRIRLHYKTLQTPQLIEGIESFQFCVIFKVFSRAECFPKKVYREERTCAVLLWVTNTVYDPSPGTLMWEQTRHGHELIESYLKPISPC